MRAYLALLLLIPLPTPAMTIAEGCRFVTKTLGYSRVLEAVGFGRARDAASAPKIEPKVATAVWKMFEAGPGMWIEVQPVPADAANFYERGLSGGYYGKTAEVPGGAVEALRLMTGEGIEFDPMVSPIAPGRFQTTGPAVNGYANPMAIRGWSKTAPAPFHQKPGEAWLNRDEFGPGQVGAVALSFPNGPYHNLQWARSYQSLYDSCLAAGMPVDKKSRGHVFAQKLKTILATPPKEPNRNQKMTEALEKLFDEYRSGT